MPEERIDHTNDAVERHPSLLLRPNVADCPAQAIGRHNALCRARPQSVVCKGWRQDLPGTIAQRLNLKHELHHTVPKLCILGFKLLERSLIAAFGALSIRTASWLPIMLTGHLQAEHILYPV